jgi:hypothetical protein
MQSRIVIPFRRFGTSQRYHLQYPKNPSSPKIKQSVSCIYRNCQKLPCILELPKGLLIMIHTLFLINIKSTSRIITQDIITLTVSLFNPLFLSGY